MRPSNQMQKDVCAFPQLYGPFFCKFRPVSFEFEMYIVTCYSVFFVFLKSAFVLSHPFLLPLLKPA